MISFPHAVPKKASAKARPVWNDADDTVGAECSTQGGFGGHNDYDDSSSGSGTGRGDRGDRYHDNRIDNLSGNSGNDQYSGQRGGSASNDRLRDMAIQAAQSSNPRSHSVSSIPRPSASHSTSHSSSHPHPDVHPSSIPRPAAHHAPSRPADPKVLTLEIAQLEQEMENCSNAVRRLQIRKGIAAKRAELLGPM